jgi:7,8-dihydropterin-6-yl-methyl-4-(beta-D-ribofuranosyl)aminobenzene 5'-phosphate synthase
MDNSIDLLMTSTEVARRVRLGPNLFEGPQPRAEHGFSVLISVKQGDREASVLFDTGVSKESLLHNMDVLEVSLPDIRAIVLSHGHADHAMGLPGLDGLLLVSGEVARTTDFETGFPVHQAKRGGVWVPDPLIPDDQCVIINVRDKGLVIVTGCGHSGIINIIRNAQALTGVQTIHAVIGGFHLSGPYFEKIIPRTVEALQQFGPRYVVPGHCTGWVAAHRIARTMPDAFIANSVGTTYML